MLPTGRGGTSGGAVAMVRPETEVSLAPPSWAPPNLKLSGDDWIAIIVRVPKQNILIINAYFNPGSEFDVE